MNDTSDRQEVAAALQHVTKTSPFKKLFRRLFSIGEFGPFVVLVVQLAVFCIWDPAFYSNLNISNMLNYVPELGIIALGMTLLLTAGEFDLSVGSVFGFTQSFMFILVLDNIVSMEVAFVLALLLAALNGLIIGLLVTKLKISSFLVTLAMMLIVRGSGIYITDGFSLSLFGKTESWMREALVHKYEIGGIKIIASMFWWLGLAAIMHFVLNETVFGNWIMATGGNAQSAKARGTNTDRVKILLFMLTSVLAAFASVISAFRISQAAPISGNQYELEVIAMVVIGGTLLNGGHGTIVGSIIGALLLRSMRNGINFVGIPGLAFPIFIGLIILLMLTSRALLEKVHLGDR